MKKSIIGVLALLGAAGASWPQESRGGITGKVTDPQGSVIPNAAILITNIETNTISRTVSNQTGYFEVNLLNPGQFCVHENLSANFSVDLLNATNHTNFGGPSLDPVSSNFGRVTSQNGLHRVLQFTVRLEF